MMRRATLPTIWMAFFSRQGLCAETCLRTDGRWSILHDHQRLDIYRKPDGQMILEARIAALPEAPDAAALLLERALHFSTLQMKSRREVSSLDAAKTALMLQCCVQAKEHLPELEAEIGEFLAAVDHWRQVVTRHPTD